MTAAVTSASSRQRTRSPFRRAIAAFAVAAVVVPTAVLTTAGPSAAQAAPTFTVTPKVDLDPAGDTVTVQGTGYPDDVGVYVRFCAAPTGAVGTEAGRLPASECNGQGTWVTNSMAVPGTTPITDGAWTVELDAATSFGDVECTTADPCGVAIRRDHDGPNDFSYDSFTPVTFAAPVGEGPTYAVTPTTGLDAAGDTVQVEGSKYPADEGFYVRLCAAPIGAVGTAAARPSDCDGRGIWVTNEYDVAGTTPNDNGSWNLELDVAGAFASDSRVVDCTTAGACGVFVRRDTGGASDYSLDSFTPLAFDPASTPPVIEAPAEPSLNTVELSLSKTSGLADGETVTASGTGYTPNGGIYAQFCAKPTGQLGTAAGRTSQCYPGQDGTHTVWVTPVPTDGTFSASVKTEKSFELEDGTVIDCSTDGACGVFTRRDHNGGGDSSQDAFVGVSFGDGVAPQPADATLSADRTVDLTPEGDVIEVDGTNFRPGVDYVVTLCVVDDPAACDFANAVEVTSGDSAGAAGDPGSFAVDLDVKAAFGPTDCLAPGTECAVSTFAVSLSEQADEVELPVAFAAWSSTGTPGDAQGVGSDGSIGGANGGVLPRTGSNTIPLVAGGFTAVLLGAGLVFASRRPAATT